MTPETVDPRRRTLIVFSTTLASMIFAVDTSIANVALPNMQATMGVTGEQIIWVVTSYMIASAIATPLSSWLASRYGRKPMLLISVGGFTLASVACGLANDLTTAVIARSIQGITGAGMVPLSQAAVIDITPQKDYGKAMGILGLGTMIGPLIGPTLGGWLTVTLDWRWVYFINLPIGLISFAGLAIGLYDARDDKPLRFDLFGFVALSILLGAFQLILDRGHLLDWFDSREILLYAVLMALFGFLMAVHMFTARDTYVRPQIFADRNFALGCVLSIAMGVLTFSTIPLTVVMMQHNLHYTPFYAGLISSPRSIGTLISMLLVVRLIGKVDSRWFLAGGLAMNAVGLKMLSSISLEVDESHLLLAGLFQGFGSGLMFPPLTALIFATIPPAYRNEGSAMFAPTRSMGSSLGISYLQTLTTQNTAIVGARLVEGVRPDNPVMQNAMPDFDFGSLPHLTGMKGMIFNQANMVGYVDAYWLIFLLALAMVPVVMLMRPPNQSKPGA
ncbi:MAG: DHA2 family efflux MFS transporter permease subunit [Novosphingobium sp.]